MLTRQKIWTLALTAPVLVLLPSPILAAPAVSKSEIAKTIKADVASIIAGINAHDPAKATAFDAPDIISMESMREPSVGADADKKGIAMAFQYSPSWHLRLIDETVDVSEAGDMAVYRSTYDEDSEADKVPMTHRVNYIAGFAHDPDGTWRIHWSVVCAQSRSHKAATGSDTSH